LYHDSDQLLLVNEISTLSNILYISGVFQSSELKKLKNSCDCFISLHRSEGWGLNILDSVLSGKPVIVSAFGGSEQYMLPLYEKHNLNELRIPISIVNITKPFGPYSTDMYWAEPNIEAAIYAMRQVYLKPSYYASRAAAVRSDALNILSPQETGLKMKRRLDDIYRCLCSLRPMNMWGSSCFAATTLINSNVSVCRFGIDIGRSLMHSETNYGLS
jgi:glycosyltransferase involved in cell wall biosynthesis